MLPERILFVHSNYNYKHMLIKGICRIGHCLVGAEETKFFKEGGSSVENSGR